MRVLAAVRYKNGDRQVWAFNTDDEDLREVSRRMGVFNGFYTAHKTLVPPERIQTVLIMQADDPKAA